MNNAEFKIKERKVRISNALLLNASFIENLGLMYGKMGICIYFFHLAKSSSNPIYESYAEELLDEIFEEISTSTPLDFENGLAGIGWGIEYLAQNGFVEADTDEVLEEFDNRLFKELIYNTPRELSLLKGLTGLGAYFLKRIQNPASNDEKIPHLTNKQLLIHIIDILDDLSKNTASLIQEPGSFSASSNNGSDKVLTGSKKQLFDLVWDYPVLIHFLVELHEQNIFNYKTGLILERFLRPLTKKENWPELHSNRLLLLLAIEKWKNSKLIQTTGENHKAILNETDKVNPIITRDSIKAELANDNVSMRYGTSGISWLYKQLYALNHDEIYKEEAQYWQHLSFTIEEVDTAYAGFAFENEEKAFGVLEGLAGLAFNTQLFERITPKYSPHD